MTIFAIATSFTLLLLVIAAIGLFAMMGELTAKVDGYVADDDTTALPVEDAVIGTEPSWWPDRIAELQASPTAVVLVLSPLCSSCARIAPTVAGYVAMREPGIDFAVVVSCADIESGTEFVHKYKLDNAAPTVLDVSGKWLIGELGVNLSPAALLFQEGRLRSASTIGSLAAVAVIAGEFPSKEEANGRSELTGTHATGH